LLQAPDLAALLLFAFILPWMVAGFRNAVIGLIFMQLFPRCRGCRIHAAGLVLQGNESVTASIAILLCVRNERPIRIIRNLEALMRSKARNPKKHRLGKTAAKPQRKSASASDHSKRPPAI
jgi:membrane glycosyltransferase